MLLTKEGGLSALFNHGENEFCGPFRKIEDC